MSHPIDVGSVLGGRYKVTATVLTSHDQDLVLDGVDQVLNRPVSILVAGPGNADQVAQSAREVATGERAGNVQILDLGVSDNTTYLITNHSSAPDLLDLVVASNEPYVEPFFTDTLGSEIFGQPRSREPEPYDGYDDEVEAEYIRYDEFGHPIHPGASVPADSYAPASEQGARRQPVVPPMPDRPASGPGHGIAAKLAAAAAGAGAAAAAAAAAVRGSVDKGSEGHEARRTDHADEASAAASQPSMHDRSTAMPSHDVDNQPTTQAIDSDGGKAADAGLAGGAAAGAAAGSAAGSPAGSAEKPKVSLWSEEDYNYADSPGEGQPSAGQRSAGAAPFTTPPSRPDYEEEDYYDEPGREPRSLRWLVGGILAAVLVIGLILAVTNLGSIFPSGQTAANNNSTQTQTQPGPGAGSPSAPQTSAPVAGPPAIESITRLGDFSFAGTYDKDLGKAFDGNAASYWSDMEFATEDWGGLASEVPLVVKLKAPSTVSSITLSQLGASGGSINVFTNDRPSMDGAKQVGTNSFTSPDLIMPLPEPRTAQYVIISIKTLPRLAAPKTRYGYGLRLAEVKIQ